MLFTPYQRSLVGHALNEAEERTARYYCIPPYRWHMLPFDLLTREDQEWRPLPDSALAEVLHMQRSVQTELRDFFRIQLDDEGILRAVDRELLHPALYSFLVFILTHEMVHLVRLTTILDRECSFRARGESEEGRVHRISRQILAGADYPGLAPVLERFCA